VEEVVEKAPQVRSQSAIKQKEFDNNLK